MLDARSPISKLLSVSVFPVTLAGLMWAAWLMHSAGIEAALIIASCSVVAVAIVAIAERLIPFRADWNQNRGDIGTDILHNIFSSYASREIYKLIFIALLAPLVIALAEAFQGPDGKGGLWANYFSGLPLVIQVFLLAAIAEFGNYWVHRASHETDLLWRFHSVHHSPKRLYWLNAGRDHPISVLALYMAASVPLILLGAPAEVLVLYYVMEAVHGLFQHCNIRLRLGPLNWLFSMAELHRWHHSIIVKEANANYGLTLIIWDILFGTRYMPSPDGPDGPDEIGIDYANYPTQFSKQMLVPFRWDSVNKKTD